jgi:hypothetical protein
MELLISTSDENLASQAVARRLGFRAIRWIWQIRAGAAG